MKTILSQAEREELKEDIKQFGLERHHIDHFNFQGAQVSVVLLTLLESKQISPTEFCVMLIIDALNERCYDDDGFFCRATNKYLAEKVNVSRSWLANTLTNLRKKDLIVTIKRHGEPRLLVTSHMLSEYTRITEKRKHEPNYMR